MPESSSNIKERSRIDVNEPRKFMVLFQNDDFTPMEFVVDLLVSVFFHDRVEAESIMLKVHHEGSAVVGVYTYDIAFSKADKAINMARSEGYPLRVVLKPAD